VLRNRVNTLGQSQWIYKTRRVVANVGVEIRAPSKADGVFANESSGYGIVVSGAIVRCGQNFRRPIAKNSLAPDRQTGQLLLVVYPAFLKL